MTDTATAAAETLVAPTVDTSSPPGPAPQETPANGQTPGAGESNAQPGSGAGEPAAAKPDGEQGEGTKDKPKSRFQERIDDLTAARREAERRASAAEARAAQLMQQLKPPGPNASLEEQDDYRVEKAVVKARADELVHEAKSAQAEATRTTFETFAAKAEAVADRMPGLVDKFCDLPEVSPAMASFVAESDKGAEVAFHLAQNPNEATRIARLSPLHQGIELARLEGKLSVAPQIRKVSTAPSPPPTVTGNPSPASRDPHEMSQAEYNEWYRKRNKRG
jgi:hypothetical protein